MAKLPKAMMPRRMMYRSGRMEAFSFFCAADRTSRGMIAVRSITRVRMDSEIWPQNAAAELWPTGAATAPDDAAYDGSDAPHAVKGAHNASAVEKLHAHGLRVQRNIEHIVAETEKTSAANSQRRSGATASVTSAVGMTHMPSVMERRLPICPTSQAVGAMARSWPTGAPNNMPPSSISESARALLMSGMRIAQEEKSTPMMKKKCMEGHAVIRFGRMRQNRCEHMVHCLNILKTFLLPC